jgi:hypothetical protein
VFGAPGRALSIARNALPRRPAYAVHDGAFVLLRDTASGREQLFDLSRDPAQRADRAAHHPLEALRLREELFRFQAALNEPAASAPANLSRRQRENLRALGYVQ